MRAYRSLIPFIVVGIFLFVSRTNAVSVYPEIVDLSVEPGMSTSTVISIGNDSETNAVYDISVREITFAEDGSLVFGNSGPEWIALQASSVSVESSGVRELTVTLTPPNDFSPGVYTFSIIAQERDETSTGISFTTAYASLVFVDIGEVSSPIATCITMDAQRQDRNILLDSTIQNSGGGILYVKTSTDVFSFLGMRSLAPSIPRIHRVVSGQARTLHWETSLPWWMVGPIRVGITGLDCDNRTLFVLPSLSFVLVFVTVVGIPGALGVLWRRRS
ncbi:MAG: hypothetical protein UY72_C0007G0011 [Candidatus Uhrbacteria bacterium GW2011_GWD2_52_7]|uniref:Uncharacterized protein n=1 Tax=Candidatus Uhrbacteria bacterium GW2011_GWD2_52_7 TaxID=1618989 RepID=A0A0G2ADW8_9BACT|nr:MAG: hypothetical protein UY72_C0007G0011 [Candidatus Uhrbacteria bacterium GW2011_GWD2_52_7]